MRVNFISQNLAESLVPRDGQAMISITSPNSVAQLDGWENLVRLQFHDIDTVRYGDDVVERLSEKIDLVLFDENQAREVINFLQNLGPEIHELIVHCEAGVSRSAAVALFACEMFDAMDSFPRGYSIYNKHVYRVLKNTWMKSQF